MIKKNLYRITILLIIILFAINKNVYGKTVSVHKVIAEWEKSYDKESMTTSVDDLKAEWEQEVLANLLDIFNYDRRVINKQMAMQTKIYILNETENECEIRVRRVWSKKFRKV